MEWAANSHSMISQGTLQERENWNSGEDDLSIEHDCGATPYRVAV